MPYKDRDIWSARSREYLNFLRPPGVQSERGVVSRTTRDNYRLWLKEAGEILGHPNPASVPLERMRALVILWWMRRDRDRASGRGRRGR